MSEKYKFKAFISYNHNDKKFAKWLQEKLEHYSVPTVAKNDRGEIILSRFASKERYKVFRYETDLVTTNLNEGLRNELDRSEFLIVVCSPNSAKSDWVGKEINHFITNGKRNKIVPIIIDGSPYSEDEECLRVELLEEFTDGQLLGVDVREPGNDWKIFSKERAVAKVVSLLMNIPDSFELIWNRYRHQILYKWIINSALGLFLVLLSVIGWIYNKDFSAEVKINEISEINESLPQPQDAKLMIEIDEQIYRRDVDMSTKKVRINNIVGKYKGKNVRVNFSADGYMSTDTVVRLTSIVEINIWRNPLKYGNIQFVIKNDNGILPNESIKLNDEEFKTNKNGRVSKVIPLKKQKPYYCPYSERYDFIEDTLYPETFNNYRIVEVAEKKN